MFSDGSLRRAESSLFSQDESNAPGPSVFFARAPPFSADGDSVIRGADIHGDGLPQSGQILGGLKHRLLSFILQDIQNDDTSPAIVRGSCLFGVLFVIR